MEGLPHLKADKCLTMKKLVVILGAISGILHPLLIYVGFRWYSTRLLAFCIGLSVVAGLLVQNKQTRQKRFWAPLSVIVVLSVAGTLLDDPVFILYMPACISLSLLLAFSSSLLYPPNAIEMFARLSVTDLSPEEIAYCRQVTLLWVGFFFLNGTVALYTACCTSLEVWGLYNGLLAYGMMGLLFAGEVSYRSWRFRRYTGLPTDYIFKKLFPPKV